MRDVRSRPAHLSSLGLKAGWELGEGVVDRQLARGDHHVVGNPLGKGLLDNSMCTRGRVLLEKRRQLFGCKTIGDSHERRPDPAVNERHFATYQTQANDIGRLVEQLQLVEDGMTLWMAPPTSFDRLTGDQRGDVRQGSTGRLQHHPVLDE